MVFQFLFFTGWWAYFAAAAFVAGSLLFSILTRPKSPSANKLEDIQIQSSTYGARIKELWGRIEIAPQIIFAKRYIDPLYVKDPTSEKVGTLCVRKEEIEDDVKVYKAYCTIALGLCAGPIDKVTRIKANGKVIYDDREDAATATRTLSMSFKSAHMSIHKGSSSQGVDSTLQTAYGRVFMPNPDKDIEIESLREDYAGYYTAHRGLAYIVLKNFSLFEYGNQVPQFLVEVVKTAAEEGLMQWEEVTPIAEDVEDGIFSPRKNFSTISTKDRMFLVGGKDGSSELSDVWSSTDGETWRKEGEIPSIDDYTVRLDAVEKGDSGAVLTKEIKNNSSPFAGWLLGLDSGRREFPVTFCFEKYVGVLGGVAADGLSYSRYFPIASPGSFFVIHNQMGNELLNPSVASASTKNNQYVGTHFLADKFPFQSARSGAVSYTIRDYENSPPTDIDYAFCCGGYSYDRAFVLDRTWYYKNVSPEVVKYSRSSYKMGHRSAFMYTNSLDSTGYTDIAAGWDVAAEDCGIGYRYGHYMAARPVDRINYYFDADLETEYTPLSVSPGGTNLSAIYVFAGDLSSAFIVGEYVLILTGVGITISCSITGVSVVSGNTRVNVSLGDDESLVFSGIPLLHRDDNILWTASRTYATTILVAGGYVVDGPFGGGDIPSLQVYSMNSAGMCTLFTEDLTGGAAGTPKVIGLVCWGDRFFAFVSGITGGKLKVYNSLTGRDWGESVVQFGDESALDDYDEDAAPSICVHNGSIYIIGGARDGTVINTIYKSEGDFSATSKVPVDDIITEVCAWGGLSSSDVDVTDLVDDGVSGFVVSQVESVRSTLESLVSAFFLDVVEINGKLVFRKRGHGDSVVVDDADLGVSTIEGESSSYGSIVNRIEHTKDEWQNYPSRVEVRYISYESDYNPVTQSSYDVTTPSKRIISVDIPIVLSDDEAKKIAKVLHDDAYLGRDVIKINLPIKYLYITPTDILTVSVDDVDYVLRVNEREFDMEYYTLSLSCSLEDIGLYEKTYTGIPIQGVTLPPISPIADTRLIVLDTPILRPSDNYPGVYVIGCPDSSRVNWTGCSVLRIREGETEYAPIQRITNASFVGGTISKLAAPESMLTWDRANFVDVRMSYGIPTSYTEEDMIKGKGAWLCGDEIIQVKTVTPLGGSVYRFSHLLRGRIGTEYALSSHNKGEPVIEINSDKIIRMRMDYSELGTLSYFTAVSTGRGNDVANSPIAHTYQGVGMMPLSPTHLNATRNTEGDWTITWMRRTRGCFTWIYGFPLPLYEEEEKYEIEFLNEEGEPIHIHQLTVLWKESNATPRYTLYAQTRVNLGNWNPAGSLDIPRETVVPGQDFIFGGPVTSLRVNVYQISATMGRGFPRYGYFTG